MAREYKDLFTLDGKLRPQPHVTRGKVAKVKDLVEGALNGDRQAKGMLEESIATSDAIFNFAHLTNIQVLQNFPDAEREWQQFVSNVRTVGDFNPVSLYSMNPDWAQTSNTLGASVVSPRVPEAATYPYAYFVPEQASTGTGVQKYGFKTGFTFEAFINDSTGFLSSLPSVMEKVALDTEEYIFFNTFLTEGFLVGNALAGGVTPEGDTVVADAPISRAAVIQAIIELGERQINNRKVVLTGGYKLLIPAGTRQYVEFALNPTLVQIKDGSFVFNVNGYDPLAGITVVETEHLPDGYWAILPNGNSAGRPIIEAFRLAGHELPELRVQGNTGTYVGGGTVSPFEGNFDNDTADFRIRQFFGAHVWTPELIIWSDGTGS